MILAKTGILAGKNIVVAGSVVTVNDSLAAFAFGEKIANLLD